MTQWREVIEKLNVSPLIKKSLCLLRNPTTHHHIHKITPPVPVLNQLRPVHIFPSCLLIIMSALSSHFAHSLIHRTAGAFLAVWLRFVQLTTNHYLLQKLRISGVRFQLLHMPSRGALELPFHSFTAHLRPSLSSGFSL